MKHVRTESELQAAVDNGLLMESHWLDLKTEVGTSRSENRGFAKDCAAFALDGGEIIVGVHEEGEKLTLTPVELGGLNLLSLIHI